MKQAGCRMISFGVESGSNYMLKKMKKGITVSDSFNAIKICNKVKIETSVSVVVGFPGETKRTILETKIFLKQLNPLFVTIFRLIPYPGTVLFEDYLKQQGKKKLYINEFESIGERFLRIPKISDNDLSKAVYKMYLSFYASPKKLIDHLVRVFSNCHLFKGYYRAFLWLVKQKMKF